ncbi:Xaa-Pro aminopeptidase [Aliidiomarina quisquiliarum]|uniref:Xaa-Pro aminopeptidase n=1 Tax=Aliidiomarina quisquiliarum TaxID=2938947 RepID=UPI00208EA0B1|nr:Xaa-Pro aminopeptidase [Aliidiomarina quisquiliarum]MCO4322716.1 Xaa-Pro aminopeptidase [Aliidiomarina quisquiliarum]
MIPVAELHARRTKLVQHMVPNSVAIIPAGREVVRSNDTHYSFRQNSDYWYCSGINEPDGVLVVLPKQGELPEQSVLFVLPRDQQAEIWHGRRLGCDMAKEIAGVDRCESTDDLEYLLVELLDGRSDLYIAQGDDTWFSPYLAEALSELRAGKRQGMQAPERIHDLNTLLHNQRLIKSPYEQEVMRQACKISADAHRRAMKFTQAGLYEYQVAAEIHHEFAMRGASGPAYGTICGSGENACILHYTSNSDQLKQGDLLLIDAGAEYLGYAGDITRTFPVSGTFTEPQRKLYKVVLQAQEAALAVLKPGVTLPDAYRACTQVLVAGLVELGILVGDTDTLIKNLAFRPYFMHGLGHWLGLDVHDMGNYQVNGKPRPLEPGMVLTVEPGIYIPINADCPVAYRGIGIRIEDDILITEHGYENLTATVPKSIEGIEALMRAGR